MVGPLWLCCELSQQMTGRTYTFGMELLGIVGMPPVGHIPEEIGDACKQLGNDVLHLCSGVQWDGDAEARGDVDDCNDVKFPRK